MILLKTPPMVSIPNDKGATSTKTISLMSPFNTPPQIAAPMDMASSGLTPLDGFFQKNSSTIFCTIGILDIPPTSKTSSIWLLFNPESLMHSSQGCIVFLRKPSTNFSNAALVRLYWKCFGPEWSEVRKGRLISDYKEDDSSIFAFSLASLILCMAILSLVMSMLDCFLNSLIRNSVIITSMSSPPHDVSPFVALTSKTPSIISNIEMSKVPPPRSYTAMTFYWFLSSPQAKQAAVGSLMILSTSKPEIFPASLVACL